MADSGEALPASSFLPRRPSRSCAMVVLVGISPELTLNI